MSNDNDILKQGYIRLKRKNIGQWRKVYVVFKRASSNGPQRLEKYKTQKSGERPEKVISLKNVENVTKLPKEIKESAVSINFTDGTSRMFACDSDFDASEWKKLLEKECMRDGHRRVHDEIKDTFHVKLLPTPNLDVNGECRMQITSDSIHLFDINDYNKCLVTWPLNSLRKYGRDESKFTFEAGRFCPTGEGMFIFRTTEGEKIHNKVHEATLAIAAIHKTQNAIKKGLVQTRSLPSPPPVSPPPFQHSINEPDDRFPNSPPPPPPRPDLIGVPTTRPPPPPILQDVTHVQNGTLEVNDTLYMGSAEYTCTDDIPREMASPLPAAFDTPTADDIHTTLNKPVLANNNKEDEDDLEYIYEEKYLATNFRKFLQIRKEDTDEEP